MRNAILACLSLLCLADPVHGEPPSLAQVAARMRPYDGVSVQGVDTTTLVGKVMCGYQGWFTTPGDGAQRGWTHYSRRGRFEPGSCNIDFWPDVSELDDEEKFSTANRWTNTPSIPYSFIQPKCRSTVLRQNELKTAATDPSACRNAVANFSSSSSSLTSGQKSMLQEPGSKRPRRL